MNLSKKKDQSVYTIDIKHTQLLNDFHVIETETVPNLIIEKNKIKEKICELRLRQTLPIEEYMEQVDRIRQINMTIKELRKKKKTYLLDNSKYVFQYFEDKKNISSGENSTQNTNVLNSFFKIQDKNSESVDKNVNYKKSANLYWKNVNNELMNVQDFVIPTDICISCSKGEMIPQEDDGIMICNNIKCGKFIMCIGQNTKPSNKEPPNEVSYTAYIRLNHFKEILSQFQAKETTQIPDSVIQDIKKRIKKERIKNIFEEINYDKMREILRKLGYNKYFEHIQYINSIFGIHPPLMCEELYETLCVLFIEIQKPWAVHCPANRTNFFNYTYTLYQLCVLLEQTQYLPYIPLMKDRDKQIEQDQIWFKVCKDLDWVYYPTV